MKKKISINVNEIEDGIVYGNSEDFPEDKIILLCCDNLNETETETVAITSNFEVYCYNSREKAIQDWLDEGYDLYLTDEDEQAKRFFKTLIK